MSTSQLSFVYVTSAVGLRTSRYQGPGFTDELEDFGSGVYLEDTVSLQGVTTAHMSVGYITSYGNSSGLLVPAATIAGRSCWSFYKSTRYDCSSYQVSRV
jgi:hypothetical protein